MHNKDYYSTDVYGRMGSPIYFSSEEEFNSATVTIHYDDTQLGETLEENLGILWFDEESGFYIIQDQAAIDSENDTITLDLEHFSTYVVVDMDMWLNPVYPDYSNNLFIGNYSDGGLYWEGRVPSLDEYEASEFGWWKAINGVDSNCRILLRLFGNWYEEHRTGSLLSVHFDYDWLIVNTVDNDTDDIFDFLEDRGVMGTNKHIYYADSSLTDKDGDGLSDGKEFGELVVFANYNEATVTNSSVSVSGYTPTTKGKFGVYVKLKANPSDPHSDNDNADDGVDATPMTTNEPINYILYSSSDSLLNETKDSFYNVINNHQDIYSPCIVIDICKWDDIKTFFKYMQYKLDKDRFVIEDGIAYSMVDNLIMIGHGSTSGKTLYFIEDDKAEAYIGIDDINEYLLPLISCKIKTIDLQGCFTCKVTDDSRIFATEFLNSDYIDEVYATPFFLIYVGNDTNHSWGGVYRFRKDNYGQIVVAGGRSSYPVMWRIDD